MRIADSDTASTTPAAATTTPTTPTPRARAMATAKTIIITTIAFEKHVFPIAKQETLRYKTSYNILNKRRRRHAAARS